uniref:Uncharacterized protein n=1 Tax=Oryza meridionalis TaxID=40149 RepID=A0A0E0EV54_9ORYZ
MPSRAAQWLSCHLPACMEFGINISYLVFDHQTFALGLLWRVHRGKQGKLDVTIKRLLLITV